MSHELRSRDAVLAINVQNDAPRAVDVSPGDGKRAIEPMRARGAHIDLSSA